MDDLLTAMVGLPLQAGRDSRPLPETAQAEAAQQDAFLAAFSGEGAKAAMAVPGDAPPDPRAWAASPPPAATKGQTVPRVLAADMLIQPPDGVIVAAVTGHGPGRTAIVPLIAPTPMPAPLGAELGDAMRAEGFALPVDAAALSDPSKPVLGAPLPDPALQQPGRAPLMPQSVMSVPMHVGQPPPPPSEGARPLAGQGLGIASTAPVNAAQPMPSAPSAVLAPSPAKGPDSQGAPVTPGDGPRPGPVSPTPLPIARDASLALSDGRDALGPVRVMAELQGPVSADRTGHRPGSVPVMPMDGAVLQKRGADQRVIPHSTKAEGAGPDVAVSARVSAAPNAAAAVHPSLARPEMVLPPPPRPAAGATPAQMQGLKVSAPAEMSVPNLRPEMTLPAPPTPEAGATPAQMQGLKVSAPAEMSVPNLRPEMTSPAPVMPALGGTPPLVPGSIGISATPDGVIQRTARLEQSAPMSPRTPAPAPVMPVAVVHVVPPASAVLGMPVAQGATTAPPPPPRSEAALPVAPVSSPTASVASAPPVLAAPVVLQPQPEIGMGGLRAPLTFDLIAGPEADPALGLVAATSQPLAALGERALPPDLPPQAARQIAVALADVSRDPGGAVEVALDPPELGRVRLSLVEVNGAMTLSIIAERPETADLMRRHLALLAEEFARQGLDAPSVDISGGGQGGQGARDAQSPERRIDPLADLAAPTRAAAPPSPLPQGGDGGLDLRL